MICKNCQEKYNMEKTGYIHIWKDKNKIGHVDIQWLYDVRVSWFNKMEHIAPIEKIQW